jgi:hypothetical protein
MLRLHVGENKINFHVPTKRKEILSGRSIYTLALDISLNILPSITTGKHVYSAIVPSSIPFPCFAAPFDGKCSDVLSW